MRVPPHITNIRTGILLAIRTGGHTFDPREDFTDALEGLRTPDTPNHLVAIRGVTIRPVTTDWTSSASIDEVQRTIIDFWKTNSETFRHPHYYLGLWLDKEAGVWCIDLVDAFRSGVAAQYVALAHHQKAICSLDKTCSESGVWLYPKVRISRVDPPPPPTPAVVKSPTPPKVADGSGGNPKDAIGRSKAPLHLVPGPALVYQAYVHDLGARKYGPYNWRNSPVNLTVYLAAMERHLLSVLDGEDLDPESGLPHVAHIAAGCNIVLDAKEQGTLIDDRAPAGKTASLLARLLKERGPQPKETPNV